MGKNRPVIQGDGRVTINHRSWSAGAGAKESRRHDDASRRQVSDQVGKTTRRGDVIVSRGYIPVHSAIHDLFSNLDRVVLAVDFGQ